MAFKAEFGHCNVYPSKSRNNKHLSLGRWLSSSLLSYKTIKQGGIPRRYPLSKGDIKRLENVGFECVLHKAVTRRFDSASRHSKQSLGTSMCLNQDQVTITTILWEDGAMVLERHMTS
jgi:hypothetical protein